MQTPGLYNPLGVEPVLSALRGPQGTQVAGDLVPMDFTGGHLENWQTNGPAVSTVQEMVQKLRGADKSNVKALPRATYEQFIVRHPEMARPAPMYLPPFPVSPNDPHGQGGNLPPKM